MLYHVDFVTIVNNREHNITTIEDAESAELAIEICREKLKTNPYVVIQEIISEHAFPYESRYVIHN